MIDHLAAQTILLEIEGGPTSVRDADLNDLYEDESQFDRDGKTAKKVRRVYDFLYRAFPDMTTELERFNVIVLYCLASVLIDGYVCDGLEPKLHDWFISFEAERKENESKEDEHKEVQLVEYRRLISQSTDSQESIAARLDVFEKRFFDAVADIEPKDPQRGFSHEQRLAIFRRDAGICQLKLRCNGVKVNWDHWHADHKVAHSKGGKSIVANGQVACPECNLAKGANALLNRAAE
jgi:HNH endonuclease